MTKEREDIIGWKIKIPWTGLELDMRSLGRSLRRNTKPDEIATVAERFIKVFKDHRVKTAEIPRLFREVTLAHLNDHEKLLSVLTPQLLKKVADFFGIQQGWLEGTTDRMYVGRYSYKFPERFFEDFKTINRKSELFPVIVFFGGKKLNRNSLFDQRIVFVFKEAIAEFGERTIYKYLVQDGFLWNYWKCRIQVKAMMRVLFLDYDVPVIPYYEVSKNDLEDIEEGRVAPAIFDPNHIGREVTLENYALYPKESAIARETDELPAVVEYINDFQLSQEAKRKQTKNLSAGRIKFH